MVSHYKVYSFFFPFASLCSGAEYLLQVVRGAIPRPYFDSSSTISTAEITVHLLDYLYKKLDQVCLVQGGEVVAFFIMSFSGFFFPLLLILSLFDILIISLPGGRISHAAANLCCKFTAIYRGFGLMVV